mmetsp:Transcript_37964/g.65081  ORF Transcript_37964/g.65081 Transcript_37964/m.65081 type:complete len:224 (+) Transcript_37964:634-1305(+)
MVERLSLHERSDIKSYGLGDDEGDDSCLPVALLVSGLEFLFGVPRAEEAGRSGHCADGWARHPLRHLVDRRDLYARPGPPVVQETAVDESGQDRLPGQGQEPGGGALEHPAGGVRQADRPRHGTPPGRHHDSVAVLPPNLRRLLGLLRLPGRHDSRDRPRAGTRTPRSRATAGPRRHLHGRRDYRPSVPDLLQCVERVHQPHAAVLRHVRALPRPVPEHDDVR